VKVAVIGSGISGLVAAYRLAPRHEVTLFEAAPRLGGHTHTVAVEHAGRRLDVDTGFIVFNERTYPNFVRLLGELDVATRETLMSFSVRCESTGLEYSGTGLGGFFAQRRRLLSLRHWGMLRDVLRFQREAPERVEQDDDHETLGAWLERQGYGEAFLEDHILPMGGAIWSGTRDQLRDFPARAFLRFFANHGLLQLRDRPRWRTIVGGSRRYLDAMLQRRGDRLRVRLGCPVRRLRRADDGIHLDTPTGPLGPFDRAIVATHSDQALALLDRPSDDERRILSAIRYQRNEAVLHTDERLLPRAPRARAAWNYHRLPGKETAPAVTYWMNALQGLRSPTSFCVTLNRTEAIAEGTILRRIEYAHPVFDTRALEAQRQRPLVSGRDRVHFAGAYWRYGFHEDGVVSALQAIEELEQAGR